MRGTTHYSEISHKHSMSGVRKVHVEYGAMMGQKEW